MKAYLGERTPPITIKPAVILPNGQAVICDDRASAARLSAFLERPPAPKSPARKAAPRKAPVKKVTT